MANSDIEKKLWAITREDHNGNKYIFFGRLTELVAEKILSTLREANKHHQDYYVVQYSSSDKKKFKDYFNKERL